MGLGSFFKRNKKEKSEVEDSHIDIDADGCDACEKCVIACPNNVLILNENSSSVNNAFACKRCHVCEAICPNDCIVVN